MHAVHDAGNIALAEPIAAKITYEYLANVFGDDAHLKMFARELISSRKGEELQLLLAITNDRSTTRSAEEIITEVKHRSLKVNFTGEGPRNGEPQESTNFQGSLLGEAPGSPNVKAGLPWRMVGLISISALGIGLTLYSMSSNRWEFVDRLISGLRQKTASDIVLGAQLDRDREPSQVKNNVSSGSPSGGPPQASPPGKQSSDEQVSAGSTLGNVPTSGQTTIGSASNDPFKGMPLQTLCQQALNASRSGWESTWAAGAVAEAKTRGLSIQDCVRLTLPVPAPVPPTVPAPPTTGLEGAVAAVVCRGAINGSGTGWDTGPSYQKHVEEALRRGLSLTDCVRIANVTTPATPPSTGLEAAPVAEVCRGALNSSGTAWDPDPNYSRHVQEASKRGMSVSDCARIAASPPTTPITPSSGRTRYDSRAGWNAQFNLQEFYIDPEANDSFDPRRQAYVTVLKSKRTANGEPAVIFIQVSVNAKCVRPSTYANGFSNRVRRLTYSDQSNANWFNFYIESAGFKTGDQIKDFLVLDRISTRRADESTLVHVGARGPSEMSSLIRSEFSAILSNLTYPLGPFTGRCP